MLTSPSQNVESAETARKDTSSPRRFYAGMAVWMIAIVLIGFWPTYFSLPFSEEIVAENIRPPLLEGAVVNASWLIHLHVVIFGGWLALFLGQTVLVARDQTRSHMRLGRWAFLLGVGAIVLGIFLSLQKYRGLVLLDNATWAEAPTMIWRLPGLMDMIQFSILLGLGYLYRRRPPMHKRLMLFATAVFLHPAFGRMALLLGSWSHQLMVVVIAGPVMAYDLYTRRRIHPATLIGTTIIGIDVAVIYPLLFW